MKYVEAMLQPVSFNSDMPDTEALCDAVSDLLSHFDAFEEGEEPAKEQPSITKAYMLAKAVGAALERFEGAQENHECENELMVPVGDVTPLADQLYRRNGFLPADLVAIVKLADLEKLKELELIAGPSLPCCGKRCIEHVETEEWVGFGGDEAYAVCGLWCPDAETYNEPPDAYVKWSESR